jgi:hypothetical protein
MRLTKAAELVEGKAHETLTYFAFPVVFEFMCRTAA